MTALGEQDEQGGWRPGVAGTVRGGPYQDWPAVVREVRGDLLLVEVVLTGAVFELETTSLQPYDSIQQVEGEAERKLLEAIMGEGPAPPPAPDPPRLPEPVLKRSIVVEGVRLAHLVHAMSAARWTDGANDDRLWTAGAVTVYRSHDGCGNSAAVAWSASGLVLALYDHESDRSPFNDTDPPDPLDRMIGLPPELRPLALRALYTLVMAGGASPVPMVTTAAWTGGEDLACDDPWPAFFRHGGHLVERLLLPPEAAMRGRRGWQVHCALTEPQATLALALATSTRRAALSASELATFLTRADPDRGEAYCKSVLRQLGLG